ncbi:Toxin A [uncultured Blautia sp.]|nr:L,D-transpeptidase family protein [Hoministercoradaptatus ammoniilyticus]SCJ82371.1 Toxin A [uncultured Blautia sp.]
MKRRASLLFGLGVLVSLSMSVPTYAATDNTQSIPQTQEAQQNEEGTETSVYKISEKTENGRWQLLKQDGAVVTERNCFYIMGEYCYYVDADGYICTGFVDAAANETTGKVNVYLASGKPADSVAAGTYYASEDGDTPEKGLGNIQKSSWVKQNTAWRYLDENGRAVDTKEKAGWQNIQKTWYALKTDGTVDESVNGWENVGDIWLNSTKGVGTIKTGWQNVADKTWLYLKEDGTADKTKNGMQNINGKVYFLKDGVAQSGKQAVNGKEYMFDAAQGTATQVFGNGWQKVDGNWYWYENGAPAKGWRVINGKWYYMETSTGVMKTGFFRDANGGLYYSDGSGAMVGNPGWNVIGGKWYWMNSNGSIYSGWLNRPSGWYYLNADGSMATGWAQVGNTWYYMNGSGAMQTGWVKTAGGWYYLTGSGAMATGWYMVGGTWYYSNNSGTMQTGWVKVGNTWYYMNGSGAMQTGWVKTASGWYYLTGSGAMATDWYQVGGTWYYSNNSGTMQTGWVNPHGTWYYLDGSGAMATNRWIGNYYVTASGAMAKNTWVGSYWVGADGKWVPGSGSTAGSGGNWEQSGSTWYYINSDGSRVCNNWKRVNGKWYYFEADGSMVTGWKRIDGYKYYFNGSGAMVQDLDGVIGRQSSYYITVNRAKCQVMVYAKSETGKYDIPVKTFVCSVGMPGTPTPTGTFTTPAKYRWHTLMGPSYGQYCTRIVGGVLFHSVAGSNMTSHNLSAGNYNMLGQPASHGCVRLCVRDAKWIYDNCALGTTVTISDTAAMQFDKPTSIKIPASQNWDPTDPNA